MHHPHVPPLSTILSNMVRLEGNDGALVGGSYAYGKPASDSDLNLNVLGTRAKLRISVKLGELTVTCWHHNIEQLQRSLANARNMIAHATLLDVYARGIVIFDPAGLIAEIQSETRKVLREGRPEVADVLMRAHAESILHEARQHDRPTTSEFQRLMLKNSVIQELTKLWHHKSRRFQMSTYIASAQVQGYDDRFASRLVAISSGGTSICEFVLEATSSLLGDPPAMT
jgi:hypothetical protein